MFSLPTAVLAEESNNTVTVSIHCVAVDIDQKDIPLNYNNGLNTPSIAYDWNAVNKTYSLVDEALKSNTPYSISSIRKTEISKGSTYKFRPGYGSLDENDFYNICSGYITGNTYKYGASDAYNWVGYYINDTSNIQYYGVDYNNLTERTVELEKDIDIYILYIPEFAKVITECIDIDTNEEITSYDNFNSCYGVGKATNITAPNIENYKLVKITLNDTEPYNYDTTNIKDIPIDNSNNIVLPYYKNYVQCYYQHTHKVIANYINENGKILSEPDIYEGVLNTKYETTAKEINGYTLKETPLNHTGFFANEDIIVNYVYVKKASLIVNYIDENKNKLSDSETTTGKANDNYSTKAKTIYGYELIAVPDNATGIMAEDTTVVDYVYRLKDSSVIVNYIDEDGNKLLNSETISGKVFDDYNTNKNDIDGYTLKAIPENANGTMTEEQMIVNYVYTKNPVPTATETTTEIKSPNTGLELQVTTAILTAVGAGIVISILSFTGKKKESTK